MSLINQPVDIFIAQLTYLPFKDVKALCSSTSELRDYCTNPKYNNNWKKLIDNTFGNVDHYEEKLKELWLKLEVPNNTYNYRVYTDLINILDPVTQHMIWYQQGDMELFNKGKDNNPRYLALFMLGKTNELTKSYKKMEGSFYLYLLFLLLGSEVNPNVIKELQNSFIKYGNKKGAKMLGKYLK